MVENVKQNMKFDFTLWVQFYANISKNYIVF